MSLQNENMEIGGVGWEGGDGTQQRSNMKELSGYSWQATQNQNCILK